MPPSLLDDPQGAGTVCMAAIVAPPGSRSTTNDSDSRRRFIPNGLAQVTLSFHCTRLPGMTLITTAIAVVVTLAIAGCASGPPPSRFSRQKHESPTLTVLRPDATHAREAEPLAAEEDVFQLASHATDLIGNAETLSAAPEDSTSLRSRARFTPAAADQPPSRFYDLTESQMLSIALTNSPVARSLGVRVIDNPEGVVSRLDRAITHSDPVFGVTAALAAYDL
ncbi:MAG: hypothetical protein AAGA03_05175, partial [Planctomycetota bacterium]